MGTWLTRLTDITSRGLKDRGQALAICRELDYLNHAVYVMIEARAPPHEFGFLFRCGHDPIRFDSRAQDSGLHDEELDAGVVAWREESREERPK